MYVSVAPGEPGNLRATVKEMSITLDWSPPTSSEAITGYEVGIRLGNEPEKVQHVSTATFTIPVISANNANFFYVRAKTATSIGLKAVLGPVLVPPSTPEKCLTNF